MSYNLNSGWMSIAITCSACGHDHRDVVVDYFRYDGFYTCRACGYEHTLEMGDYFEPDPDTDWGE